jgi:hypothetical protein
MGKRFMAASRRRHTSSTTSASRRISRKKKQNDPVWAPISEGYKPVQAVVGPTRSPECFGSTSTTTHVHVVSSSPITTPAFALRGERRVLTPGPTERPAGPRQLPAGEGAHEAWQHHIGAALVAMSSTCRFFPDKGPGPRACCRRCRLLGARNVRPNWPAKNHSPAGGRTTDSFPVPSGPPVAHKLGPVAAERPI